MIKTFTGRSAAPAGRVDDLPGTAGPVPGTAEGSWLADVTLGSAQPVKLVRRAPSSPASTTIPTSKTAAPTNADERSLERAARRSGRPLFSLLPAGRSSHRATG